VIYGVHWCKYVLCDVIIIPTSSQPDEHIPVANIQFLEGSVVHQSSHSPCLGEQSSKEQHKGDVTTPDTKMTSCLRRGDENVVMMRMMEKR